MRLLLSTAIGWLLLVTWCAPVLACDGTPPELVNKDQVEYSYVIECGKKTHSGKIPAGGKRSLKEMSGCKLKLGENKPTKLYTEMVCTIKDGKLTCELL